MNRKVLIVDSTTEFLGHLQETLGEQWEVRSARTAEEALAECRQRGPFACVITSDDLPDLTGFELLAELEKYVPDTTRVMMAEPVGPEVTAEALRRSSLFRLLPKSADRDDLVTVVSAGVERFRRAEEERLFTEQLLFSRESLLALTENLEHRLARQIGRLRGMHDFAAALQGCETMTDLAELAAGTVSRLLDDRPVEVTLGEVAGPDVIARAGGDLPSDIVTQSIATNEGRIGRIRLALGPPVAKRLARADLEFIASVAASTSVAAHNQISRHERDSAQHATIFALARLAEFRDDETGRHLERVTEYCQLTAEALREEKKHVTLLTDSFLRDIGLAAPLHDIGKVGVPDAILLKPGKLTEEEWVVMRKHTTIGAETLKSVLERSGERSFLRMGHEIAWCHHEKWGGGGYPRGLRGSEIPLSARIMALADCYDALTTPRPYKGAWTHAEAVAYILEQRGAQFDPDIVDVFEKHAARFDEIRVRLADKPDAEEPAEAEAA